MFEHEMEESKKVSLTEDFAHKYLYVVKKGKSAEHLTEEGEYCVIVREWRGGVLLLNAFAMSSGGISLCRKILMDLFLFTSALGCFVLLFNVSY